MCISFVHASQYEFSPKGVFDTRNPKRQVSADMEPFCISQLCWTAPVTFRPHAGTYIPHERLQWCRNHVSACLCYTGFCMVRGCALPIFSAARSFATGRSFTRQSWWKQCLRGFVFMEKECIRMIHVNSPKALFGDIAVILDHIVDHCDRSGVEEATFLQNTV